MRASVDTLCDFFGFNNTSIVWAHNHYFMVIHMLSPLPPISTTIGDLDLLHVMKPWYCWKYPTHLQCILTDHVSTVMLNVFQVFARKWQHARRLTPQCLQNAHS